ncbi:MAG: hypothetical protein HWD59_12145 [Coxiellaceae bacterium]|nr:MAG: hypothetical protein HWD59_12145 [Coxiellaceae bacterium]
MLSNKLDPSLTAEKKTTDRLLRLAAVATKRLKVNFEQLKEESIDPPQKILKTS